MKFKKDLDVVEVIFPRGGPPNDLSYVLPWDTAHLQLARLGVQCAESLVDYVYNFGSVIYEVATGRYYYDPPADRAMVLPAFGGVEIPLAGHPKRVRKLPPEAFGA